MRWRTGPLASVFAFILVTGCVAQPSEDSDEGETQEPAEPNITDADLSGLAVLLAEDVPIDPEENPGVTLNFHDPDDGSLRTSLTLSALVEDTEMDSQKVMDMALQVNGRLPRDLDFSADFRRMAWENGQTGAVHVAELDDETAEYRLLTSFEIDVESTLSGDQPSYTDVQLSPDGSQVWFVRSPGDSDDDQQEIVSAELDMSENEAPELTSRGEVPDSGGSLPLGGDSYWDVSRENEFRIMSLESTAGDDHQLAFYTDGDETVPYAITVDGLGARSGEHEYGSMRRVDANTYVALADEADRDVDSAEQLMSFRFTDDHEVTDIELLAETEDSHLGDVFPDPENDTLLMPEMGNRAAYQPYFSLSPESDAEPRMQFEELERREESGLSENVIGIYPEDKTDPARVPQIG